MRINEPTPNGGDHSELLYFDKGEKYRSYKGVENYAPDIISMLESLKNAPSIKKLEKLDLISNAVYYNKIVPKENERREKWHKGAPEKLG